MYHYIRSMVHWWKVLSVHGLVIILVNAYIVMIAYNKKYQGQLHLPSTYGQLEFSKDIIADLIAEFDQKDNSSHLQPGVIMCLPGCRTQRADYAYCNGLASLNRDKCPSSKTTVSCMKCLVPFCVKLDKNCFAKWHSDGASAVREKCNKRKLHVD